MAGLGTFATTTIITGGLNCGPACRGLITAPFSIYCSIEIPDTFDQGRGGGGGPYPHPAHNVIPDIHSFYKEVPDQFYDVPRDKEAEYFRKHINVTVKINMGTINVEKIYRVPEKNKHVVINIFNILNATQSRLVASINNLKAVINKANIVIRNLRVRKDNG